MGLDYIVSNEDYVLTQSSLKPCVEIRQIHILKWEWRVLYGTGVLAYGTTRVKARALRVSRQAAAFPDSRNWTRIPNE